MVIWRNRDLFLLDLVVLPIVVVLAFALRLDASGMQRYTRAILLYIAVAVPTKLFVFYWLKLYSRFWQHAGIDELLVIVAGTGGSVLLASGLLFGLAIPLSGVRSFPRSIPLIDGLLTPLAVGGPRFAIWLLWRYQQQRQRRPSGMADRVLVVGAGDAGIAIIKEMRANPQLGLMPIGFVDDDETKQGMHIQGLPVFGGRERIAEIVVERQVSQVIVAMPSAPGTVIREVLEVCERVGLPARTIPSLRDILAGRARLGEIREIRIEDLLRRAPVEIDAPAVGEMLRACRVLVTGAGGSIGSELCRQIAHHAPEELILIGHGENSVFSIANEISFSWPTLNIQSVIADVRDEDRLGHIFRVYRPQIVFHAAAHKHVTLMEMNPQEAVTNNILGTANLLRLSEEYEVDRFVLISSDKVVQPTSVMGVTKRVAELLVQHWARRSGRRFTAVRFGNVLGSRGSVVPLFQAQIARGGPVTVTDPEARRFFMVIPEAVELVLHAATLGQGGEVFILDMGEPVRIVDLATDLIRLSGRRARVRWPGQIPSAGDVGSEQDIEVVFTGLKPGEKLSEELVVSGEECVPTRYEKVLVSRRISEGLGCPVEVEQAVMELGDLTRTGDSDDVLAKLREIVPSYAPPGDHSAAEMPT
jgi:FlaA1/EpsC-like NDP-sugar epimerase